MLEWLFFNEMMQRPIREMQRDDEERRLRNRISDLEDRIPREVSHMWITEEQLKGLIGKANEEALKGRKLVSVEFHESADKAGFITMLNYEKPKEP